MSSNIGQIPQAEASQVTDAAELKRMRNQRLMQRLEKKYSEQGDEKELLQNNEDNQYDSSFNTDPTAAPSTQKVTSSEFKTHKVEEGPKSSISGTEKLSLMKKRDQMRVKYEGYSIFISGILGLLLTAFSQLGTSVNFFLIFVIYQVIYQITTKKVLLANINSLINQEYSDFLSGMIKGKAGKAIDTTVTALKYGKDLRQVGDDISMFLFTFVVSTQITSFL